MVLALLILLVLGLCSYAGAGQVWIKCHVTCRCQCDNTVGNFAFMIPVDRSPDIGFEADQACNAYANRVCTDGCNGLKFTYTYQVTSP